MNKIFRNIRDEKSGNWIAVSEHCVARGKAASTVSGTPAATAASGIALAVLMAFCSPAQASRITLCYDGGTQRHTWTINGSMGGMEGRWQYDNPQGNERNCSNGASSATNEGIILSESDKSEGSGLTGPDAYLWVGSNVNNERGMITLYGPAGIRLRGETSLEYNRITHLADGVLSSDAATVGQMHAQIASMSTSLQAGGAPIPTRLASLDERLGSLSAAVTANLATASTGIASLSTGLGRAGDSIASLSTGLGQAGVSIASLSTGLGQANESIASLSTSTGKTLDTTNGAVSSLSTELSDLKQQMNGSSLNFVSVASSKAGSRASGTDSIALGPAAEALGAGAIALGDTASAAADGAMALGRQAAARELDALAIGIHASALNPGDVALGAGSTSAAAHPAATADIAGQTFRFAGGAPSSVVSVGAPGAERQIVHVAAGRISGSSTDAVNGSQLDALSQALGTLSTSTAGALQTTQSTLQSLSTDLHAAQDRTAGLSTSLGAATSGVASLSSRLDAARKDIDALSTSSALAEGQPSNLASRGPDRHAHAVGRSSTALGLAANASGNGATAVGHGATALGAGASAYGHDATATDINATALGTGATASAANAVAIGSNSLASEADTVSFGSATQQRRLSNLAPGRADGDAATMGQLRGVQAGVDQAARRAYSGVAAATALTMIPEVDPGRTIAVGIGTGSYQGYAATALGVSLRLSDNLKAKLGVGMSGQGSSYGGGMSYQW